MTGQYFTAGRILDNNFDEMLKKKTFRLLICKVIQIFTKNSTLPKISSPRKPRVNVSFCISVGTSYSHSAKPFFVSSLKGKSENVLIFFESI